MATIKGTTANDILIGGTSNDSIFGDAGDDSLTAFGGTDSLYGGKGDDVYYINDLTSRVIEYAGEGTEDTVISSVNFTLSANVEILRLLMGSGAIKATGNASDNTLYGNDNNNELDGGKGNDLMYGGKGDDIYVVDSLSDKVFELDGEGRDTIKASISYKLLDFSNIENLTLTGNALIDATGNELNNSLLGNNSANILDGGIGADYMNGVKGNDTYIVDNEGDIVFEDATGGGVDTILSSITYNIPFAIENAKNAAII